MVKNLRSLIHEKFPFDLRVQIELLSRRRDIINAEKHQELIKLLQSYNVEGVVPLGPGTNRYAFKLDGFVVKVATDNDGKIDNYKEFKMAKRLYPYVTKIFEVSENGSLLVAEYIQPFASYPEMCKYADEIRDILTRLSSVYLIGDVGITSKNYANWGLRVGSNDPVCLDFAYVYEVSSELFICRNCHSNSMLVPNRDFTELYCPNKGCNKHYLFEDIRARIGNDIHRHEIGDLSQEGYRLYESGISVDLDSERSNYLVRRKEKEQLVEDNSQEVVEDDSPIMNYPPSYYIDHKEEAEMSIFENKITVKETTGDTPVKFQFSNGLVIKATAKAVQLGDDSSKQLQQQKVDDKLEGTSEVVSVVADKKVYDTEVYASKSQDPVIVDVIDNNIYEDNNQEEVAFSWQMNQDNGIKTSMISQNVESTIKDEIVNDVVETPIYEVKSAPAPIVTDSKPVETPAQNNNTSDQKLYYTINENFLRSGDRSFSKLSNRIGQHMRELDLRDIVGASLRDKKMFPEQFYRAIQNAIFRSLTIFCQFKEIEVPNRKGNGTHTEFTLPDNITGTVYEPTMIFVARFWNNKNINMLEESSDIMLEYRDCFNDYRGIQREWLPYLETRISQKMNVDAPGIKKIVEVIAEHWCVVEDDEEITNHSPSPTNDDYDEEEIAFSGEFNHHDVDNNENNVEVAQNPVEDDGEEYTEDESEPEYPFSVEIFCDDTFDVVKVISGEAFGPISIPFYTHLDDIDVGPETQLPSIADNRNGVWDWLIHLVPDMMFKTRTPEKWLAVNEYCGEINQLHIVIMHQYDNGEYVMGIYYLFGVFIIDDEGVQHPTLDPVILAKINKLIRDDIGYGSISHLQRSLTLEELIRTEEYISQLVEYEDDDPDSFDDEGSASKPGNDPEEAPEFSAAEDAAIKSIMGDTGIDTSSIVSNDEQSVTPEETVVETSVQTPSVQQQKPEKIDPVTTNNTSNKQISPGVFMPVRRGGK